MQNIGLKCKAGLRLVKLPTSYEGYTLCEYGTYRRHSA